jgi:hypothetical protein
VPAASGSIKRSPAARRPHRPRPVKKKNQESVEGSGPGFRIEG